jgi:hypothetical protein
MNAQRARGPFRLRKLVPAIIAPLLPLVMSGAALPQAQNQKVKEWTISAALDLCGPTRKSKPGRDALTDWDGFCLQGKVKTLIGEDRTTRAEDGLLVEGDVYAISKNHFDERGNLALREAGDNTFGPIRLVYRLTCSFDAQGRKTGCKSFADAESGPYQELVYSYDERGNRVRMETKRPDMGAHFISEFSYDAEGRKVEERSLSPEGRVTFKVVYTYEGNLTHSRGYSSGGTHTKGLRLLHDDRGNLLSEEHYSLDARGGENVWRKVTYKYDRRGFRTEVNYHKADEGPDGARVVYEYDERGNVASLTKYLADGSFAVSEHREYEYDAGGNWVKRVIWRRYSAGGPLVPQRVERRRLTYY